MEKVHNLILSVWKEEVIPKDWNMAVICPIHKKGDKLTCTNYRGIALLNSTYKVFAKILACRLKPYVEDILGDYQCGIRGNRSTTDQIFSIRTILEKCYEYNISTHHLFVDFKQAYDSIVRDWLYQVMTEFGIPSKLVNLTKMAMKATICKVKIQGQLSQGFPVNRGLRQGDVISTILFNICLENVMRNIELNPGGTIFNRTVHYLAYADDVDLVARSPQALAEAYEQLERGAKDIGLVVNVEKTKYMLASKRVSQVTSFKYRVNEFERVRDFQYLGSTVTESNDTTAEVRKRISAGNKSYFASLPMLKSKHLSRKLKLQIYTTIIKPVVLYGSEAWTLNKKEEEMLLVWERKILRKIFGPLCENGVWRIRTNKEVQDLYDNPNILSEMKSRRLQWAGHVERAPDNRTIKKLSRGKPEGRRNVGRPRKRWLDEVEGDLRKMGVRGWRSKAGDREEWRKIVKEAKVLLEL